MSAAPAVVRAACLLLLLAGVAAPAASAQDARVRGFVTDASSGESMPGVNVAAFRDGELVRGAATDTDGFYTIAGLGPGVYLVQASFLGFAPVQEEVELEPGEVRQLNLALSPADQELDAVTVESERTSGAANVTAGLQSIRPADIELVPTPDVSGDLASYLTTLPGVVSTGDRGGQLFIRGGEPSQNEVLLDGIPLFQPFHVLGFYSAFPNTILNRADVYAGAYSARFGGRLSSVIDIATRNGNKQRFGGAASVAPFVSALEVEGPIVPGVVSVLGSARLSVIEQGAANLVDQDLPFSFGDVFAKVHARSTPGSQLSLSGVYTWDRGTIGTDTGAGAVGGAAPDEIRYTNAGVSGRYLFLPGNLPVLAEIILSGAQFETEQGPPEEPARSSSVARVNGQAGITYRLPSVEVRAGAFIRTSRVTSRLGEVFQNVQDQTEYITEAGFHAEPEFNVGFGLKLRPGVYVSTSPNQNATFVEPRFRAVWDLGVHHLSGAVGLYHQEIVGLTDRRDATSVFTAWTVTPLGEPAAAFHAVAGYRLTPTPWLDLAVEGFYKDITDLSVPEWTAFPRLTTRLQPADGTVRGLDARVELRPEPFYVAANYGLSSVEYRASGRNLDLWYGNETLSYRPPHDRRQQANVILGVTAFDFDLSVRWQFGAGLPYSRALGFDGFILMDGSADVTTEPGDLRVIYERPYNGQLPTYHRLDVSLEREFAVGPALITGQLGVINVYDRQNLFYYDVFTLRRVDQLPFIPSFGLKVAFE